ncbi:phosphoribosylglycinamide formyltransferase [Thiomicrorhabdus aquaedulcis]|uniref:phosphoribosylglycinamide formyltransferase n=1 Tax=Thiomicrorhabdus aquaedulcis TaxID=2211106 RepID=UPI000FD70042|nr:phosphoribosylglycinamide formyltransferase [Thiomicrorhabdus aquaedulcis]
MTSVQNTPHTHLTPKRIAVLISGSGSNLQAIIEHQKNHAHLYQIVLVVSNRPNAFGLNRAAAANIPTLTINHTDYASRELFDESLQFALDKAHLDLVVLAGFMRILTPHFTQHFLGKMLNIHPSLLPKYPGLNTHQAALQAGDTQHGLSVHFVTPMLDSGPVILQATVNIEPNDTAESLQQKVHTQEHLAYPLVIEWFAQNRLQYKDNQAWLDQKPLIIPQQL